MAWPCSTRFHFRDRSIWGTKSTLSNCDRNSLGHSLMPSADEFYEYVEQCIALSLRCEHPGDKAHLLQMAKAWRELAEKLEVKRNNPAAAANETDRAAKG